MTGIPAVRIASRRIENGLLTVKLSVDLNAPGGPVIHLEGECDMASIDALTVAGRDAIAAAEPGGRVTIDMGALTFLDSSGLGALIGIRKAATDKHIELRLRSVPRQASRILTITAMNDLFDIEA
jgi:anti-anti-sigma factor